LSPFAKKGTTTATGATKAVAASVDNKFIKIVVRSTIIIFFAIVLIFIAVYLFGRLKEESGGISNGGVATTPSPVPFDPYKPSVYAEDPEILKLEEDIRILEMELSGTEIKEDGINPPRLDWNVNFK
jgi:hypothetical protein